MLKLMRDSFQHLKWILVALVAIFILFIFVNWGADGVGNGNGADQRAYAARVNGETISSREFDRALQVRVEIGRLRCRPDLLEDSRLDLQHGAPQCGLFRTTCA